MDSRVIKPKVLPKPLLLKDYLLDELSSCSSNGFKSFPRRQCYTTTVRFLIEIDLNNKQQQQQQKDKYLTFNKASPLSPPKSPSKSALAAFQTVITAVKCFPFGATLGSPEKKRMKKWSLQQNLSKKIIGKSSFWNKKSNHKAIQQWKSLDQLLKEDPVPSDISNSSTNTSEVKLNLPYAQNDVVESPANDDVSTDSTTSDSANSSAESKKEQFSPVSVLDYPFEEDEEEEVSSAFQHEPTYTKGRKKKVKKRIQEKESPMQQSSINFESESEQKHKDEIANHKALDLLQHMKNTIPSFGIKVKADELLLDFFREQIIVGRYSDDENMLEEAESWINGRKSRELFLEWNVQSNREVYIKNIEKGGEWKSLDRENEEVAMELEGEVFAILMNELLVDYQD